ncbi:DUF3857 domain-containing protein, partial [bacterium]|nr:DUF3857 domain-containing protein [bacterium]
DADACVIADHRRRILFEDGSTFAEHAMLIKVFTDKGVQEFGSMDTGVNPLFSDLTIRSARTLKRDGAAVDAQRSWSGRVAFQSLAPGDLIELHYHSSSWSIGKLNQEYWDSHVFQWGVPCLESSYELLAPPGREFSWVLHNHDAPDEVHGSSVFGDFELHRWRLHDVAPRHGEVHAPGFRDVATWLDVSTIPHWGRIVDWYAELSGRPSEPDPRVAGKVPEIAGEGAGPLSESRIARLYDFVTNRVAYEDLSFQYSAFIPEPAPDVLRAMYGDCKDKACLLKTMLAEVGTESYFALVSPVTDGAEPYLPSPRFRHVVLAIPTEDGYRFLDPTSSGTPAYRLSEAYWGAPALVIRPGNRRLTHLPFEPSDPPQMTVTSDVKIDRELGMSVRRRETTRTADEIRSLRSQYETADAEKRSKILATDLGRAHVGVTVGACEFEGLEPGPDSVSVKYAIRIRDAVDARGPLRLAKIPWRSRVGERYSMVVASEVRHEPLLLYGLQIHEDETLRLRIPDGWSVEGAPESVELESPYGYCDVTYRERDGMLEAHREVRISGLRVVPDEYPTFRLFLEKVIRAHDTVLVMGMGG